MPAADPDASPVRVASPVRPDVAGSLPVTMSKDNAHAVGQNQALTLGDALAASVALAETAEAPGAGRSTSGGRRGGSSRVEVAQDGRITVDLRGFLESFASIAPFRLLSTVADIARVEVTVLQGGVQTASQTLTQADIANNAVAHTFTGLANGNAIILVVAYDAANLPIGSASQVVVITSMGASVANMTVQLVSPPTPGPGGTLGTTITFVPPPATPTPAGTVLATYNWRFNHILAAGDGYLYGEWMTLPGTPSGGALQIHRISPTTGEFLQGYNTDGVSQVHNLRPFQPMAYNPVTNSLMVAARAEHLPGAQPGDTSVTGIAGAWAQFSLRSIAVDAAGDTFYPRAGMLERFSAGVSHATTIPAYTAVAIDTNGDFWTNATAAMPLADPAMAVLYKFSADGTPAGSFPMPVPVSRVLADSTGGVWVCDRLRSAYGTQAVHVATDGTIGTVITTPIADFSVAADGSLWVATGAAVHKYLPDGTLAANVALAATSVTAGTGYVFAGISSGSGSLHKLAP